MNIIELAVFDLSGTTVEDDKAVARCSHQAAPEHALNVPLLEFKEPLAPIQYIAINLC